MSVINLPLREKAVGSMIAAAAGDALGWPFEERSRRIQTERFPDLHFHPEEFFSWTRGGARSEPYREPIKSGEYSDDTQLLLATARSLLRGNDWWDHFSAVELPCWLLYERGGGGATKRAAQSWLLGVKPWENHKVREQYFEAGGNGVCMRILPHLLDAQNFDPIEIARRIVANGICTHGHPRALVGALLHGMALWLSIRQEEMLEFGALIETICEEFPRWASFHHLPEKWQNILGGSETHSYIKVWEDTVKETTELLKIARESLRRGPLSVGPETLQRMGALNPKTNGSGTITAVASLFLASRYASSPLQGMIVAATSHGADTDTLASMAASILSAIHGYEWLGHFSRTVQDSDYIRQLAAKLAEKSSRVGGKPIHHIAKKDNADFSINLKNLKIGSAVIFPDGRKGLVKGIQEMFSETAKAELLRIEMEDGQTFPIKRIARGQKSSKGLRQDSPPVKTEGILKVGIKLYVSDLKKARDFYVHKLNLSLDKEFANGFTVAGIITLHLAEKSSQGRLPLRGESIPQAVPCIRVAKLSEVAERLTRNGVQVSRSNGGQSYSTIHVTDPFGNGLEIFEA